MNHEPSSFQQLCVSFNVCQCSRSVTFMDVFAQGWGKGRQHCRKMFKNSFSKCKQGVDLEKCIKYIATVVVHRSRRHCGRDKCILSHAFLYCFPWRVCRSPGKGGVIQVSCCVQSRFQSTLPSPCGHRPTCPSGPDCGPRAAHVSGADSEHPLRTRPEACLDNASQKLLMQPRVLRRFHSASNSFLRTIHALWRDFSDGFGFRKSAVQTWFSALPAAGLHCIP